MPQQVAAQEHMFQNWARPEAVRSVRRQPQGQGARLMAAIRRQSTKAQFREAGAAIQNALPQQVDVLNEDVIQQSVALHARHGQL